MARTLTASRDNRGTRTGSTRLLQEVLSAELASRHELVIRQPVQEARFPDVKTLDTLISLRPTGSATQIPLARGEWVLRRGFSQPRAHARNPRRQRANDFVGL
jgi:hypothetical protein